MIDINKMFKSALEVKSIGDAVTVCAESLTKRGVDLGLAMTIAHATLEFSQFVTMRFDQSEFRQVIENKKLIVDLVHGRVKRVVDLYISQAKVIFYLNDEDSAKVEEILTMAMSAFFDDPIFVKNIEDMSQKIAALLASVNEDDDDDDYEDD